jgi:hypothetical protein
MSFSDKLNKTNLLFGLHTIIGIAQPTRLFYANLKASLNISLTTLIKYAIKSSHTMSSTPVNLWSYKREIIHLRQLY